MNNLSGAGIINSPSGSSTPAMSTATLSAPPSPHRPAAHLAQPPPHTLVPPNICSIAASLAAAATAAEAGPPANGGCVATNNVDTASGSNVTVSFEHVDKWSPEYQRNNKRMGLKNLRCFPHCASAGHVQRGFCGAPVVVRVARELGSQAPLSAYGEFRRVNCFSDDPSSSSRIRVGDVLSAAELEQRVDAGSPESSSPFHVGRIITTMSTTSDNVLFTFNERGRGWNYSWGASKHTMDARHAFVVYVFREDTEKVLTCIHVARSPSFALYCRKFQRNLEASEAAMRAGRSSEDDVEDDEDDCSEKRASPVSAPHAASAAAGVPPLPKSPLKRPLAAVVAESSSVAFASSSPAAASDPNNAQQTDSNKTGNALNALLMLASASMGKNKEEANPQADAASTGGRDAKRSRASPLLAPVADGQPSEAATRPHAPTAAAVAAAAAQAAFSAVSAMQSVTGAVPFAPLPSSSLQPGSLPVGCNPGTSFGFPSFLASPFLVPPVQLGGAPLGTAPQLHLASLQAMASLKNGPAAAAWPFFSA